MAESVLPAGLEMLKIDLKRELDDFGGTSNEAVNPFSFVGSGARKKIRKVVEQCNVEDQHSCPLGIFGNGFTKSTSRPTASTCRCNVYVPTKFRNHGKRSGQDGSLLQVKATSTFKRNIVQKSKLNYLNMHEVTKQSCHQIDPLTQSYSSKRDKSLRRQSCIPSSEAVSEVNSSKRCVESQIPGTTVLDFKSLIPLSEKQISSYTSNPVFDSLSFKSLQNSTPHSRHYCVEHLDDKSEEDDLVNSVSKKLSVSGIAASNSNASCSQEARLTANAYCDEHDISIDELASYFEDFVHIPKKMSLMAEQMYI